MTTGLSPQPNVSAAPRATGFPARFWLLVVLTGIGTGLAAGLLMTLLAQVQHAAWSYRDGTFLEGVERASWGRRIVVLLATGALVAAVLPLLGRTKSKGPSEVEASIWFRDGRLPAWKTAAKGVFSIVIVGLGASLGREQAPKQFGTLIGGVLAQWRGLEATKRRLLAACGAGAGIAAVYNVPFGGALFALEVLLGSLALPLVAPAVVTSLLATAAAWLILPRETTYHVAAMPLTASFAVFAVAAGPVFGVASAGFTRLIAGAAALRPSGWRVVPAAFLVFGALGLLAIPFPQLLGNGKNAVQLAAEGALALPTLAVLALLKPLVTAANLGTGAPGGLFTPTLTFGALLGGALGQVWLVFWPGAPAGAFALLGATAMLAATSKGPISAVVLMMELTGHLDGLLVPMLLCVAVAVAIAHRIEPRSVYTCRLGAAATVPGEGPIVSVATPFPVLLRASLATDVPMEVRDVDGTTVGTIARQDLLVAAEQLEPHEIATAIDVLEARAATS